MTSEISVTFNCKKCGTKLEWLDDITDDVVITCKNCGEYFGTYADLKHTAIEAAKVRADDFLSGLKKGR